jgi:DNA-binding transcriptional MerR regulator
MTIKQFASLCGCNPQTLRYYDRINLLKPVQVDHWSGYRYYEEKQALSFVKIRNLQSAGFTIEEIKTLLDLDNEAIYGAFCQKITELESRLKKIKEIQQSYHSEMSQMKEKMQQFQDKICQSMEAYDPEEEFGLDTQSYGEIITCAREYLGYLTDVESLDFSECQEDDKWEMEEEEEYAPDFLQDPDYEIVYEKHDWSVVREFLDEIQLEHGEEYAFYFEMAEEKLDKLNAMAFTNTVLGLMIKWSAADPDHKSNLSCNVTYSKDHRNHVWLLKKKEIN